MRKRSFAKMLLNCFCISSSSTSCFFCINNSIESDLHEEEGQEELARTSFIKSDGKVTQSVMLKDVLYDHDNQTLAFQLKPKMVMLRVSMHCHGCANKVKKHISKMNGVTSYKVDLESNLVVVVGDIFPFEVLQSVSKVVKYTELWNDPSDDSDSTNYTAYF